MGRRSRCTPSRETSGPWAPSRPAILSSSSRKTMPESSTRRMAWLTASSTSTSFWASSWAEEPPRLADLEPPPAGLPGHEVGQHVLDVHADLFHALARRRSRTWARPGPGRRARSCARRACPPASWARSLSRVASLEASGETSSSVPLEKASPGRRGSRRSSTRSSARRLRALAHRGRHLGLDHGHRQLGQIPDHGLDVAPDVADLGVLRGLDLDEGRLGELRQPARDLGLPDPGGPDHDDVLRRDLVAELRRQILAPPAVAQRDGDGLLGRLLADDIAVQLGRRSPSASAESRAFIGRASPR